MVGVSAGAGLEANERGGREARGCSEMNETGKERQLPQSVVQCPTPGRAERGLTSTVPAADFSCLLNPPSSFPRLCQDQGSGLVDKQAALIASCAGAWVPLFARDRAGLGRNRRVAQPSSQQQQRSD